MNVAQSKAARIGGGVLAGGIITGALLAMLVPTSPSSSGQGWREMIGIKDPEPQTTPVLVYEAPPEDLTPVSWQTAQQEYPTVASQSTYVDHSGEQYLGMPDLGDDGADAAMSESLPATLLASRDDATASMPSAADDAAGNAAQAARDAAADVRSAENAAVDPAPSATTTDTASTAPEVKKVAVVTPS